MTDAVKVSSVDVQRARLLLRLNESLGATSPDYVVKIAAARPASTTPHLNGTARPVNGVPRPTDAGDGQAADDGPAEPPTEADH